jgi:hypothetical protein
MLANRRKLTVKKNDSLMQARHHGEVTATEFNYTALPVDPFEIADKVGITVQAKPKTAVGVSGMLLRHGDSFGILYATHIKSPGYQRFSVGHELGHYFLPGHIDALFSDHDIHESRAGFASGDKYDMEAGAFPVFYGAFTLTGPGGVADSVQRLGRRCHCIWRSAGPASGWHWSHTTRPPNV